MVGTMVAGAVPVWKPALPSVGSCTRQCLRFHYHLVGFTFEFDLEIYIFTLSCSVLRLVLGWLPHSAARYAPTNAARNAPQRYAWVPRTVAAKQTSFGIESSIVSLMLLAGMGMLSVVLAWGWRFENSIRVVLNIKLTISERGFVKFGTQVVNLGTASNDFLEVGAQISCRGNDHNAGDAAPTFARVHGHAP
jgi:hypothetical protein